MVDAAQLAQSFVAQSFIAAWAVGASLLAWPPSCAHAQDAPDGQSASQSASWKDALTAKGVTPALTYSGNLADDLAGGARRGATYLGAVHAQLSLDGERLVSAPGLTAFLDGLWVHGGQPSSRVGDAQGVNNVAAAPTAKLYEAWLQYNFAGTSDAVSTGDAVSTLAGLYDLSTEFYRLQSSSLFLNSSFGTGPEFAQSGNGGPSIFPNTSVGLRVAYKPDPAVVLRGALLDGRPFDRPDGSSGLFEHGDGALLVAEAAFLNRPGAAMEPRNPRFHIGRASGLPPYDDKIALGAWHYTATMNDLSDTGPDARPTRHDGSSGAYVLGDKLLYQAGDDSGKRLTGFLQLGLGDERVDRFGSYVGSGLTATGFVPGRPSDQAGVAVAAARNGSHYLDLQQQQGARANRSEIALEVTYLAQISDWLAVQPDLQYVVNPNTDPSLRNAWVFQIRFEVSF